MAASCNPFIDLPEQLGYVQCSFCATILLVSVPCSSLLKVVTVRCGHCTSLLSVSLVRTSFVPLQFVTSIGSNPNQLQETTGGSRLGACEAGSVNHDDDDEEQEKENDEYCSSPPRNPIINKPPEKRQRAPSAYNCFIKEEIRRIKASEPNISHKEAFSAAAKNWAHFPRIQHQQRNGYTDLSCTLQGEARIAKDDIDGHPHDMHGIGAQVNARTHI